jgi:hypothetical protein
MERETLTMTAAGQAEFLQGTKERQDGQGSVLKMLERVRILVGDE